MKPFTGRIAHLETDRYFKRIVSPTPFGPGSLAWQLNLPGIPGLAAFRGLLRQASETFGDGVFPYARVADSLLDQQMAIFGGGVQRRRRAEGNARRWAQAVRLDRKVRGRLGTAGCGGASTPELIYPEYVRFGEMMGLNSAWLPATPGEFDAWAGGLKAWKQEGCRAMVLDCLTELSPLFWPVNIALIFYLLPEEFKQHFGDTFGKDTQRLAGAVQGIIMELTVS